MLGGISEISADLERIVDWLIDDCKLTSPPIDCLQLSHNLSRGAFRFEKLGNRGEITWAGNERAVAIRAEDRMERAQWTAAHEIGELVLPQRMEFCDAIELDVLCNRFAMLLLAPRKWYWDDCRRLRFDLLKLKEIYGTASHEVLALRMLDLPTPALVTIFDHGRMTRRTANLAFRAPELTPTERSAQTVARTTGAPTRMFGDGVHVCAWPVHEPNWPREILRTVLDE